MMNFNEEYLHQNAYNQSLKSQKFNVTLYRSPRAGLGNVRLAGHIWHAKHLNMAREHFFSLIKQYKGILKCIFFRKWTIQSQFSHKSQNKKVYMLLILARIDNFVSNVAREP